MRKIRRMLISLLAAAISAAALPVFANQLPPCLRFSVILRQGGIIGTQ